MLTIIEQKILGKTVADHLCEDGIFFNDDFVAVVDGATSKGVLDWNGHTSGFQAKETLMAALRELPAESSAEETITRLNDSLREASRPYLDRLATEHVERLMASVILYSRFYRQVWSFGDCQCLINDTHYKGEKKIDEILAEVRSFFLQTELASGKTVSDLMARDTGREMIIPFLKVHSLFANKGGEFRFTVLDGFEIDLSDIREFDVRPGDEIVLASDGYPFLKPTLEQSEESLRLVREQDPLCMGLFKSTKGFRSDQISFDDRAYIRFIAG